MSKFPAHTEAIQALGFRRSMVSTKSGFTCNYCAVECVPGRDFAALTPPTQGGRGSWVAVCHTCAASTAALAGGVVTRIAAKQDDLSAEQVASINLPEHMNDVLTGQADAPTVVVTVSHLLKVARQVEAMTRVEDARIIALRKVTPKPGFESSFIPSVIAQYGDKGRLSEKQWSLVERMLTEKAEEADMPDPEVGTTWKSEDGDIIIVRKTRERQVKVGYVLDAHGEWQYGGRKLLKVAAKGQQVTPEFVANEVCVRKFGAPLGSEELRQMALRFGTESGSCIFCARELTHEDSDPALGGAGYGPKCAENYGLPHGGSNTR
jgi:hypothetical protein